MQRRSSRSRRQQRQSRMRASAAAVLLVVGALFYFRQSWNGSTKESFASASAHFLKTEGVSVDTGVFQTTKKHVLVTGGAGFIGSHAALKLVETGHPVTILDNLSRGNRGAFEVVRSHSKPGQLGFLEVDLGDRGAVCSGLRASKPDLVMHFAAIAYVSESVKDPLKYYQNITASTVNLLECTKEIGVEELVYSSTCATYGNPSELPITESTPTDPVSPYGKAKYMSEGIIRDVARSNSDFKAGILRYFNVYGSDERGRLGEFPRPELKHFGRITGACMDAALGIAPKLTVMGTNHPTKDGSCVRDFIHVVDLVDAHVRLMGSLQNPPVLFNVGTGKGVSVKEIVRACVEVTGKNITVVMQEEARPGDAAEVWADPSAVEAYLGWKAKYTDVREGLSHAWEWRRKHPNGY